MINKIPCSCVICREVKSVRGIHTHYERAHGSSEEKAKYSSGFNGSYNNAANSAKLARVVKLAEYNTNPNYCPFCHSTVPLGNKFCNQSCAAKFNNTIMPHSSRERQGASLRLYLESYDYSAVSFRSCRYCSNTFVFRSNKLNKYRNFCNSECKEGSLQSDKVQYRNMSKFSLNRKDHPELFNSNLIEKYGWYAPSNHSTRQENLYGVQWDHLYRASDGIKNNVPLLLLNHPANAELIPMRENIRRAKQSTITLDELYRRIIRWEEGFRDLPRFYHE